MPTPELISNVHLWVRAEQRQNEERVGITPNGVAELLAKGFKVTVEESTQRVIPISDYRDTGCDIAPEGSWETAPSDAIIFGLKELPETGTPLRHRHIMFGHAYKGQPSGRVLLDRFNAGGGTLYDLEYLTFEDGRRVAAFGYWAGYAGAAVTALALAAQPAECAPVTTFSSATNMANTVRDALNGRPTTALIIGALGRVGSGAAALCEAAGISVTKWDMAETASGGPFPEILDHDLFFNCILARPGTPVFVPASTPTDPRKLRAIGDIACDPDSDFSPIKVYDRTTTWDAPTIRVHNNPPLDVMAIDNLPSLLPRESSEDYAGQLFAHLATLDQIDHDVWGRAKATFDEHL
ncbi:saccharopine dehydrogenase [Marivivens donghaensis]|uniref:saccharopine dehydrogenase n=1 Tax=Marivivens donghaensis TaxID=1699413 RepID=UPI00201FABF3|nr:saccharopine dehydrogenase [Marivivens donghaensis]MCL7409583.1 saccharopine dehydrogenase [Marivivens donghaensis]MDN3703062.1 saccharopine dehydrogenase [Marivivens donghaensis]